MNGKPLSEARDADLRHAQVAMERAARRARELAARTGTGVVVMHEGRIVTERPTLEDIEREQQQ
ncbi:hypothetical protein Mmc1_0786 [Magnetococcus marinus MC-1]|uniref:Uncharacterized protein n=1 Tax=Magnetococcus marinus (strain ATCC BAA-1437 / JCM 17883 / MC-1) TaxID=156889 RepID=A0L5R4_MAGMM|nr:hypothetical protein [Magnetococcus marinus]ABK43307.1 hypothetical protein Mmc1_0786 [Magnetococcus marinus MC-1]